MRNLGVVAQGGFSFGGAPDDPCARPSQYYCSTKSETMIIPRAFVRVLYKCFCGCISCGLTFILGLIPGLYSGVLFGNHCAEYGVETGPSKRYEKELLLRGGWSRKQGRWKKGFESSRMFKNEKRADEETTHIQIIHRDPMRKDSIVDGGPNVQTFVIAKNLRLTISFSPISSVVRYLSFPYPPSEKPSFSTKPAFLGWRKRKKKSKNVEQLTKPGQSHDPKPRTWTFQSVRQQTKLDGYEHIITASSGIEQATAPRSPNMKRMGSI